VSEDHEPHGDTNRFDDKAATWDHNPATVARAENAARAIGEVVPLNGNTRVLEYGAGTGLVSQALRAAVGQITMADTSAGMRAGMEAKIAAGAITDARVWDVDLAASAAPDEEFDLIVTVMALHHVRDLGTALTNFAALLADGGHVAIVDLEQEDGSFHGHDFDGHHGFNPAELTEDLQRAGFTDVAIRRCDEMVRDGITYPLFLATGERLPRR
jgi:predicted TPR repeat methyltransferase